MEYIKKEDLKEGDIFVTQLSHNNFLNKYVTGFSLNLKTDNSIESEKLCKGGGFAYDNMRLATSEEKHWLNEAIRLDKFITFEEAMKTFIPEYVECIRSSVNGFTENKIYKIEKNWNDSINFQLIDDNSSNRTVIMIGSLWQFKPSTKEAYDAQFVVKEPAENKTELEIWLENTKSLNLSLEDLEKYIESNQTCNFDNIYMKLEGHRSKGRAKILFDKWNEKVIEPLPQFKVIESIETITKVENNEGNQFFIGDVVQSAKLKNVKITGFNLSTNKKNIIASLNNGLHCGINKLEHYIEPKVEETLLEKAKRLYPIGTIVKSVSFNDVRTIGTDIFKEINHEYSGKIIYADNGGISIYSEKENRWATIIE